MVTTISKWGNSLSLRLPKAVVKELSLQENMSVDLEVKGGRIQLTPVKESAKDRVAKRFASFDMSQKVAESELEWGEPVGEEEW